MYTILLNKKLLKNFINNILNQYFDIKNKEN